MNKQEIEKLFKAFLANECSEQEIRNLFTILKNEDNREIFEDLIQDHVLNTDNEDLKPKVLEQMYQAFDQTDRYLLNAIRKKDKKIRLLTPRLFKYAAACALLLFSISFILFQGLDLLDHRPNKDEMSFLQISGIEDIRLDPSNSHERTIAHVNDVILKQVSSNRIKLEMANTGDLSDTMGTLRIGKGMNFEVELLDGTVVNINSASVFRFPIGSKNNNRKVELEGEAYFDVARDTARPFLVYTKEQIVKVYGTRFNVKNYIDQEEVMTSLFHGKVSIQSKLAEDHQKEYMLTPGQRAVLTKKSRVLKRENIQTNITEAAWAVGLFSYEKASLLEILQDFSRWYNVDVDWENVPKLSFEGTIPKKLPVEKAVQWLSKTSNIRINLNNNQITF